MYAQTSHLAAKWEDGAARARRPHHAALRPSEDIAGTGREVAGARARELRLSERHTEAAGREVWKEVNLAMPREEF
ncbi:hypothetical protein E2C01_074944 [Portunus trituberculatus]|uniref:Uncharacterized protein n=1 Tax=Portunus trituberculatus TaxID=210409 RepID=A0A5B7IEH7_PORTR|nr:hypothetical protein [Portunus trituberculatus]